MKNTIDSIRRFYPTSDQSIKELTDLFTEIKLPANHLFIEAGKMNNYLYFIEKGLCRSYCIVDDKEVTTWFSREGDITFALLTLYRNKSGFEYVETLEPTTMYAINIDDLNQLYTTNIEIANWSRIAHQECVLSLQIRRIERLQKSAKARYEILLEEQSDLFSRVKLGYLASYLGMTPQHLSKMRADTSSNDINPIF
ncbi:Crp/Fnr family transcriptional regulator [Halosquirtibacter xylanolyticus]|uniref:Crp/Fnr family transcriptional regulator n=1 Tax=Halosquirtibacter xylanolyticus TaxID=3374599 RepID=UPI003748D3CD|nr:Crp/Fnr family transcriptional regulator [Prolixibacteraceae bacterium]